MQNSPDKKAAAIKRGGQRDKKSPTQTKIHPTVRLLSSLVVDFNIVSVFSAWLWFFIFEMFTNAWLWSILTALALWFVLWLILGKRAGLRFVGVLRNGRIDARTAQLQSYLILLSGLYFVFLSTYYLTLWIFFPQTNSLFGLVIQENFLFRLLSAALGIVAFLSAWFLMRVRLEGFIPGLILVFMNILFQAYMQDVFIENGRIPSQHGSGGLQSFNMKGLHGLSNWMQDFSTLMSQLFPFLIFIFLVSTISKAIKKE